MVGAQSLECRTIARAQVSLGPETILTRDPFGAAAMQFAAYLAGRQLRRAILHDGTDELRLQPLPSPAFPGVYHAATMPNQRCSCNTAIGPTH